MSDTYRMGVSYAKVSPNTVSFNHLAGSRPATGTGTGTTSHSHTGQTVARLWKQRGGPHRRIDVLIEAHIGRLRFSYEKYPEHTEQASRQVLLVRRIEIRDRMACSQIKKFLYLSEEELLTGSGGGQGDAAASRHMLVVKALHVRPEPKIRQRSEGLLLISMLPPRLHIDQDAMLFLVEFFGCLGNGGTASGAAYNPGSRAMLVQPGQRRRRSSSGGGTASSSSCGSGGGGGAYHAPPVMMVDELPAAEQAQQARRMLCENLDLLINEDTMRFFDRTSQERAADEEAAAAAAEAEEARSRLADACEEEDEAPIYWRTIVFSPAVKITLDYHGKRVEMSQGPLTGLIMGLGQLQCTEIVLKEINYR